ncbi:MAG: hypothetical protein ACRCZS_04695 [Chroococcidiopsis sp.]
MGKRFGDLEKRALAILANGGNPATSQDEALRNYWTWKINPSANSHNLPAASERSNGRQTSPVYIKPFSVVLAANIFAKVTISQRSNTAANATIKAACELATLSGTDVGLPLKGFVPARVYWRTGRADSSTDRISRITNQPYKSYYAAGDEGFSVPFGEKGTDSIAKRRADITTAINIPNALITFSPEKYRG